MRREKSWRLLVKYVCKNSIHPVQLAQIKADKSPKLKLWCHQSNVNSIQIQIILLFSMIATMNSCQWHLYLHCYDQSHFCYSSTKHYRNKGSVKKKPALPRQPIKVDVFLLTFAPVRSSQPNLTSLFLLTAWRMSRQLKRCAVRGFIANLHGW